MRIPTYQEVKCPRCGAWLRITVVNAYWTFIPDGKWRCPYCKDLFANEEILEPDEAIDLFDKI